MSKDRFKFIVCAALILRDGDKILLSKRYNTGYQDGKFSLVSGHVDGDEFASEAMVREASEETGIVISKDNLDLVHTSHQICDDGSERINVFFEVTKWDGNIENREPNKCSGLSWFSPSDLPEEIVSYIRFVIERISERKLYSEYRGDS
ncbi:MAG: NUDIX domain-containing protein [Candidatus Saccharimonadales bacterium]